MEKSKSVKYTATLSGSSIEELKQLAQKKVVPSVNFAIREAISAYIVQTKKVLYEKEMKEASLDEDYLRRTYETQEDFSCADNEVTGD